MGLGAMQKLQLFVVIVLICVFLSACASNDAAEKDMAALKSQIIELQKSIADVNLRMEELSNSVFILQEQSKVNKEGIKRLAQPTVFIQPDPSAEAYLDPTQVEPNAPFPQGGNVSPAYGTQNIRGAIGESIPVQGASPGANGQFASAMASYKRNNFGLAVFDFTSFLAKNPNDAQAESALYYLGESYFRLNEFAQAAREWNKLLGRFPASERAAEVAYRIGLAYNALGEKDRAKTYFDLVLQKHGDTKWGQKAAAALRQ